jgi:tetratricopeptide (TPR) repeat protein
MLKAKRGPARVQALVDFLSAKKPEGLGLVYDWSATGSAASTIESGRGNCVSLATVLVALGRCVGWPIYYAEAGSRFPETQDFDSMRALSDHMAVLIAAESFQMVVDFSGQLTEFEDLRPIDDLTAYAHIINNTTAQRLMIPGSIPDEAQWQIAINGLGLGLATRIQPELGRAWNNLGIALTRQGRFEEAREAYQQLVALDTALGLRAAQSHDHGNPRARRRRRARGKPA